MMVLQESSSAQTIATWVPWVQCTAPIVQLLLVLVGWKVILWDNKKRENRKEARTLIDVISQRVGRIETSAHEYYRTVDDESSTRSTDIKSDLKRLASNLTVIARLNSKFLTTELFINFRQAVTGTDFETSTRLGRTSDDPLFEKITQGAIDLLDDLESNYAALYL